MDIYDLIKDLQSFNPDMSEYPKIGRRGISHGNFREGYVTPEETKQKLREAMLAREQDPEWLAKKPEIIAKMSASKTGIPSPKKGIPMSEESKQKMRDAIRPPISEEQKKKISQTLKGKPPAYIVERGHGLRGSTNPKARAVQCIQTGKVYGSIIECAKDNNVTTRTVRNWCQKETQTTTNGQWKGLSFRYVD